MSQTRQSIDFFEGSTDGGVDWRMLNMDAELITSSLSSTIGPGLRNVLNPHWKYGIDRGDGTVPINNILKFETFGQNCPLRTNLRQEYQVRLVATRNEDGTLKRGHVVMTCELFKRDADSRPLAGRAEFWMALTRPFAPPGERTPVDVPPDLAVLNEHEPTEKDLVSRDIESYRCLVPADGTLLNDTRPLVFHMDQSDLYRHINTNKYMDRALDSLALLYHKSGGDVGRLRFHEITIYFRKPFVPGQGAEVELDFVEQTNQFQGAVRFYHCDKEGVRSERISMAMETRGPLLEVESK